MVTGPLASSGQRECWLTRSVIQRQLDDQLYPRHQGHGLTRSIASSNFGNSPPSIGNTPAYTYKSASCRGFTAKRRLTIAFIG
jgi:hypothetical protein